MPETQTPGADRGTVVVDWLSGFCPVQSEGEIAGQRFYFRARGASWTIHIGPNPMSDDSWCTGGHYGTKYEAGWMELDEARVLIARSASLYIESLNPDPHPAYCAYLEAELAWEAELRRIYGTNVADVRYRPQARGDEGSPLRGLSDKRDEAVLHWGKSRPLPRLCEENTED